MIIFFICSLQLHEKVIKMKAWVFLLGLAFLAGSVSSAKILFLLPLASKSHVHVFEPLIKALAERKHDIVSLAPMKIRGVPSNVKEIVVVPVEEIFKGMQNPFEMRKGGRLAMFSNMSMEYIEDTCNKVFDSKEVKEMMEKDKFDLIIVDILLNYCMLGLVPHFKAPLILMSTMVAPNYIMEEVGNRLPLSFVPNPFFEYTQKMTFFERMINWLFTVFIDFFSMFLFLPKLEKIYKDKLGVDTSVYDITGNTSMILVNTHFSLTYPRPYLPDVVDVGGMHIKPSKPLPKDLDDFISGAEHGCILFSLGSIAQGKDMPEEYRKVFVNVFSRLKQRVLWKWETDTMPDLPKNVKLSKWLPQQDILGHKNIKLFMTHGGLLSVQETVYHAKPLLGIPLFGDQDLNVKQGELAGFALPLEIIGLTEETLESKLKELLENPSYAKKVKELSTVWRDQPMTPIETAVFWTEYVIRHKGAPHLRSASRDLNFFQYHSIDVISFLVACLSLAIYSTIFFMKFIWRKLCGKSVSKAKKTN